MEGIGGKKGIRKLWKQKGLYSKMVKFLQNKAFSRK